MGRSVTPKYRLEVTKGLGCSAMCWRGKATNARLADWVKAYNASVQPGGCNDHLPGGTGRSAEACEIKGAVLIRQKDAVVVATYDEVTP